MYDGTLQIVHPDRVVDEAGFAKLTGIDPVYPLTEGLAWLAAPGHRAGAAEAAGAARMDQPRGDAALPFPAPPGGAGPRPCAKGDTDILPDGPFWSRLAFDELLAGQLALALVRAQLRRPAATAMPATAICAAGSSMRYPMR